MAAILPSLARALAYGDCNRPGLPGPHYAKISLLAHTLGAEKGENVRGVGDLLSLQTGDDVAQKVDDAGATAGDAAGYIPTDPNIISNVKLLDGGATGTASFTAPAAGTYTFLCTFPGHYVAGMKGTLTVK